MEAHASLLPARAAVDRAPVLAAQGRMAEAAREMEEAGRVAAAAIYREKAKDWSAARALWSRLAHVTERDEDAYVTALVRFNLARCARQCGDAKQAREAIVSSVRLESIGRRERAFDCFQVLVQIGRESGAFEDVLEGFVNSIRILREDHLKFDYALELFDEAIAAATEHGETRAAATLARQAGEYARSMRLVAAASEYGLKQAQLWRAVAKQQQERGAPPEIAENALLAGILAFGEVGQYARVGELYVELSSLGLEPSRREHYARAARRYHDVEDQPIDFTSATARPARHDTHYPDVWHVDVLEWERAVCAAEACADILLDRRWDRLIRRKAMLARLTAIDLENKPDEASSAAAAETRLRLAEQLGLVQLYAVFLRSKRSSPSTTPGCGSPCSRLSRPSATSGRSSPCAPPWPTPTRSSSSRRRAPWRPSTSLTRSTRSRTSCVNLPKLRCAPRRSGRSRASTRKKPPKSSSGCWSTVPRPIASPPWPRSKRRAAPG